jgi:hypothetical protein
MEKAAQRQETTAAALYDESKLTNAELARDPLAD